MNELFLKTKRAIRFLFYKDISIVDQIRISKILDNEQLEQLFWKMSKADRHHSFEVLERTMKYSNNEDLLLFCIELSDICLIFCLASFIVSFIRLQYKSIDLLASSFPGIG